MTQQGSSKKDLVVWKQGPGDTTPVAWTTISVDDADWTKFLGETDGWLPFVLENEEELWRAFNFVDEAPSPASKFEFPSPTLWVSPRNPKVKFRKEVWPANARRFSEVQADDSMLKGHGKLR